MESEEFTDLEICFFYHTLFSFWWFDKKRYNTYKESENVNKIFLDFTPFFLETVKGLSDLPNGPNTITNLLLSIVKTCTINDVFIHSFSQLQSYRNNFSNPEYSSVFANLPCLKGMDENINDQ